MNNTIPADCKSVPLDNGAVVFAYGEVTGHSHQVAVADRGKCALLEPLSRTNDEEILNLRFLRIMDASGIDVVHEEHGTLHLDDSVQQQAQGDVLFTRIGPGQFRVTQQREYQPKELPRRVAD